jgi:hypothetical protein
MMNISYLHDIRNEVSVMPSVFGSTCHCEQLFSLIETWTADGGSMFLQSAGTHLKVHTALLPRSSTSALILKDKGSKSIAVPVTVVVRSEAWSWPVGCWDRGFESRSWHGCLSAYFCDVFCCVGRGLATG